MARLKGTNNSGNGVAWLIGLVVLLVLLYLLYAFYLKPNNILNLGF
ncbi:hypothetical protein [Deinococcus sp.]|nr:hypothetical protein [Deinococcus sp.]